MAGFTLVLSGETTFTFWDFISASLDILIYILPTLGILLLIIGTFYFKESKEGQAFFSNALLLSIVSTILATCVVFLLSPFISDSYALILIMVAALVLTSTLYSKKLSRVSKTPKLFRGLLIATSISLAFFIPIFIYMTAASTCGCLEVDVVVNELGF